MMVMCFFNSVLNTSEQTVLVDKGNDELEINFILKLIDLLEKNIFKLYFINKNKSIILLLSISFEVVLPLFVERDLDSLV